MNTVSITTRIPMLGWCVAVVALTLTSTVRADEAAAIAALEKLGAKIKRDETKPTKPVVEVKLNVADLRKALPKCQIGR